MQFGKVGSEEGYNDAQKLRKKQVRGSTYVVRRAHAGHERADALLTFEISQNPTL